MPYKNSAEDKTVDRISELTSSFILPKAKGLINPAEIPRRTGDKSPI